ncbi:MAG: 16S rRNA (guanine(527)-N(7))-methyltransferase RsmG [Tissierellia bacterium]|nr:16S rRNA (guanine(527)-N(7))-methyltransferase RsmG [Tissierellia bacterium]
MKKLGPNISEEEIKKLETFKDMVLEKNRVMNLTAIAEEDFYLKHFVDSLKLLEFEKLEGRVLDLGTGAGFPGIPLAIMLPEVDFLLMDSLKKRIGFLEEVVDRLGLKNVKLIHSRAEDGARKEYRESFDYVVTRALASLPLLLEYTIPYLKTGGILYAYKGIKVDQEIEEARRALDILGAEVEEIYSYKLEDEDYRIVKIKKSKATPKKYPRRAGLASKEPL